MKRISIMLFIILLYGCGTWIYVPAQSETVAKPYYDKNYKIGEPMSAFVGKEIIKIKPYILISEANMIVKSSKSLKISAKHRWNTYVLNVEKDKEYQLIGTIRINGDMLHVANINGEWGAIMNDSGIIMQNAIYSIHDEMIFYPSTITIEPVGNSKFDLYQKSINTGKLHDSIDKNWELIYTGTNDISLNAVYREYTSDDLIRPAFTQQLTYPASSKKIRFKGFLIQIDNVTNEKLSFTVIEDDLR